METHLVSFIDSASSGVARRVRRQASKFRSIDSCRVFTEHDLSRDFVARWGDVMSEGVKGFGYYAWKPEIIAQALAGLTVGDVLVYMDAGSHLRRAGLARFDEYVALCSNSRSGLLAFQTDWPEFEWTKGDLFDHLDARHDPGITETGQIQTGLIFMRNSSATVRFVDEWNSVFDTSRALIDDTPSESPNLPGFRSHRHDQSVFSILAKSSNIELLSAHEQNWFGRGYEPRIAKTMPVQHRRDRPGHRSKTLKFRLRRGRAAVDRLLAKIKNRYFS